MRYFILFYVVTAFLTVHFECGKKVYNAIHMPSHSGPTHVYRSHNSEDDPQPKKLFAVLDLRPADSTSLNLGEARLLTERTREIVFATGYYDVVTEENVEILLAGYGTTLEECAEANCELEFGTMLGADYVLTGRLNKIGDYIFVTMKVHETETSSLRGATSFRSETVIEVYEEIEVHINKLLKQVK